MNERSALDAMAVRAIEAGDRARELIPDVERDRATQDAAAQVAPRASPEAFIARRAELVLASLGAREPKLVRAVRGLAWRPWLGHAFIAAAFVAGVATDAIGAGGRINILAPPMLGLLLWNLAVYLGLAVRALRPGPAQAGPLRAAVTRLVSGSRTLSHLAGGTFARLVDGWTQLAAPLYAARAARLLHFAAAAFALGMLAGLYWRGLALEYRASWESTFLDPEAVHSLLAIALFPGAMLTGLPIPDTATIASLHREAGAAGTNAALWLHLWAATVIAVVVLPRLLFGFASAWQEHRRRIQFPLPLREPYFQRLLRARSEGPLDVEVVPYSYHPAEAAREGLWRVVSRVFGPAAQMHMAAPVAYGDEDALDRPRTAPAARIALFNLAATPESETHGAFISRLVSPEGVPLLAVVDETDFRARLNADERQLEARREAWRDVLRARRIEALFVELAMPDLDAAEAAFDHVLDPQTL